MTVFNDSMEHGFATLIEQHGETVSYKFRDSGDTVSRTAIVDRNPPAAIDQVGNAVAFELLVYFYNNEADGVQANVVNNGGDEIYVSLKINGTAEWRPVYTVMESDGGITQVAVR
ncbi:hypothetical protein CMK18_23890 [Candidatus Poribacteria bacterium]|nr:hypothetical protein [Candidatus Poribacteria bacterium]|tara:strand:+ start:173 stop:517 length:345 start_codon:yes stop_codon:yes gene_type:complete